MDWRLESRSPPGPSDRFYCVRAWLLMCYASRTMRTLLVLSLFLLGLPAFAGDYQYVYAKYDYRAYGGMTTLTIRLHNNGNQGASCNVSVFDRSENTFVPAFGDSQVSFQNLPEGAQPRYGCTAR